MCTSWSSVNKCTRRRNTPLLESGIFAKYSDCWKRDEYMSPNIPRPFPVARTQIVECVLLFNLKLLYRVGLDVIRKGFRLEEFVLMLSYFGYWISVLGVLLLILAVEVGQILSLTLIINVDVGSNLIGWILHHYGFHNVVALTLCMTQHF